MQRESLRQGSKRRGKTSPAPLQRSTAWVHGQHPTTSRPITGPTLWPYIPHEQPNSSSSSCGECRLLPSLLLELKSCRGNMIRITAKHSSPSTLN